MFPSLTRYTKRRSHSVKLPIGILDIIGGDEKGWFQSNISRKDAEERLEVHCRGTFVFRNSESISQDYYGADRLLSMSLNTNKGIKHFIIIYKNCKWVLIGKSQRFSNLGELIAYFAFVPPSREYTTNLVKSLPIYNHYEME